MTVQTDLFPEPGTMLDERLPADWAEQVRALAREQDAVILAHNYQLPEIQEVADHVGLTTVRQQLFESGRLGAELLLGEIRERSRRPASIVLAPEIVVRGTTAPAKEGRPLG